MKALGSFLFLAVAVFVASFCVSLGWRAGQEAIPRGMPESVIMNVTPPVLSVPQ